MANIHGQNSHVQLKYIQKKGLKNKFKVHFDAAIATERTRHHLQMSMGVCCERVDFKESKEKSLRVFSSGLRESESEGVVELE